MEYLLIFSLSSLALLFTFTIIHPYIEWKLRFDTGDMKEMVIVDYEVLDDMFTYVARDKSGTDVYYNTKLCGDYPVSKELSLEFEFTSKSIKINDEYFTIRFKDYKKYKKRFRYYEKFMKERMVVRSIKYFNKNDDSFRPDYRK